MKAPIWILIIIFSAAFLFWIYKDGKFHHLMATKIKYYRSPEIFTILYAMLLIFAFAVSVLHLFK